MPVVEIMMASPLVRKYILEGEFEKLKGCVGNREAGSQSFDQHLTELFMKQIIDVAEAKRQIAGSVGIDSPAGPSEILVVADSAACNAAM